MRFVVCEKQICAQNTEDRLEHRNGDEPDDQHIERTQRAIDQNLVDDDLEEQRRDKREKLEKERSDKNLAQQMAVLVDGAEKPADVEAARKFDESRAGRHQHQAAVPDRLELFARHKDWVADDKGFWTRIWSSLALPRRRKPPSRNIAMPGNGVLVNRCQFD